MFFTQAVDDALAQAMADDPRIVVFGEDIPLLRRNLLVRFGPKRVLGAPISESAFLGAGVAAAMAGLRPVVELYMVDFVGVAMDALLNHAAKLEAFSGGKWTAPVGGARALRRRLRRRRPARAVPVGLAGAYSRPDRRRALHTRRCRRPDAGCPAARRAGGLSGAQAALRKLAGFSGLRRAQDRAVRCARRRGPRRRASEVGTASPRPGCSSPHGQRCEHRERRSGRASGRGRRRRF